MAGAQRNPGLDVSLFDALEREPFRFGFYVAMRQIECQFSDKPRFGRSSRASDDPVRLGQAPSLRFSPASIAEFKRHGSEAARLKVYFQGLFGPNGPLPLHLTEYARQRIKHAHDSSMADFLDIFHHRFLSLFYRAWADKEPTVQFDRPTQDRFAFYLGCLCGFGPEETRGRDSIPDECKLYFSAHLGCHTRHADGLQSMLGDYFRLPVEIEQFIGEWLDMPRESYCYLARPRWDGGMGGLGRNLVIGTRSWQCQFKFRIRMAPLTLVQFERMLPDGDGLGQLVDLVRNYVGMEINWDLQLVVKRDEVPAVQLGKNGKLGWNSWIKTKNRSADADDLKLYPDPGAAWSAECA